MPGVIVLLAVMVRHAVQSDVYLRYTPIVQRENKYGIYFNLILPTLASLVY